MGKLLDQTRAKMVCLADIRHFPDEWTLIIKLTGEGFGCREIADCLSVRWSDEWVRLERKKALALAESEKSHRDGSWDLFAASDKPLPKTKMVLKRHGGGRPCKKPSAKAHEQPGKSQEPV